MRDEARVAQLWERQSVWSQVADRMRTTIARGRTVGLALSVAGAVCGTLAGAVATAAPRLSATLAVAAAVAVGLLPLLRPRYTGDALRDWTRARSVSEALKSELYLYLAGAGAYRGADPDAHLDRATDRLCDEVADLLPHTVGVTPRHRPPPAVHDGTSYLEQRVRAQTERYYRPKAADLHRRLRWFRRTQTGLAVVAVVLGALAAQFSSWGLGPWIAVVTTTTTAVAAYVAANRFEYQILEYTRTADELGRLLALGRRAASPADLADVVVEAERVISAQQEGWMAKLAAGPDEKDKA